MVRCERQKCGEYNRLRCAYEAGHSGDCSFVVDHENDYPHNKPKNEAIRDVKAIKSLMQRAGFNRIQCESIYNRERVERLFNIARNEALEQAAKICDEQGGLSADVAAMRIRNLKTGSM